MSSSDLSDGSSMGSVRFITKLTAGLSVFMTILLASAATFFVVKAFGILGGAPTETEKVMAIVLASTGCLTMACAWITMQLAYLTWWLARHMRLVEDRDCD
jgi:hypothetical protein